MAGLIDMISTGAKNLGSSLMGGLQGIGNFIGMDGQFGMQNLGANQGLSLANLGDAFGDLFGSEQPTWGGFKALEAGGNAATSGVLNPNNTASGGLMSSLLGKDFNLLDAGNLYNGITTGKAQRDYMKQSLAQNADQLQRANAWDDIKMAEQERLSDLMSRGQ